ncbi:MAG: NAD(P)-dependent oxidoreductase [Burkholderiales bacterium]|nr:NAD(P)-dependent oxidoreductase [Burkholderiales bacterium]
MRVLVTGASGFIGSRVTRNMLERGHEVVALLAPDDNAPRLADIRDRMTFVNGDLEQEGAAERLVVDAKPEACVHLAWYAEPGKYLTSERNLPALQAGIALLQALASSGCSRIVMAGTCAEYDAHCGYLQEDSPTRPETLYAATKLAMCQIGQQLAAANGVKFAWGRIFYLYGPTEDPRRMIPALVRALVSGNEFPATEGEQVRDYLHVDDVASAFGSMLEEGATGVFNVSSGRPITIRDLMLIAGRLAGRAHLIRFGEVPYRAWEPPVICGSNARLRELGWRPRFELEAGLSDVLDYWRSQRS